MRRVLDKIDAWLGDHAPLLTLLALALALAVGLLPDRAPQISVATLVLALLVIVVRIVFRLSPETDALLRKVTTKAATYAALLLLVASLVIVEDIRSTVRRAEPVLMVARDIDSSVRRIEKNVINPHAPVPITIRNRPLGGLYNALYDSQLGILLGNKIPTSATNIPLPGYTHVFAVGHQGDDWVVQGNEAAFSYDRHGRGRRETWASSGGFISFPDAAINRLVYEYLRFDCKVSEGDGRPDIGVRLAVDDPAIPSADKEVAAYELASLSQGLKPRPLSDRWQNYEIYTQSLDGHPRADRSKRPGIDANEINKIVFFVNDSMLDKSARGTVWIRNIVFSTSGRPD